MLGLRKIDLTYLLGQTIKWNKVANLGEYDFTQERKDLQLKCLKEEVNEFVEAHRECDGVEMLDALCDILFVGIYGCFLEGNGKIDLTEFVFTYDMINTSDNELFEDKTSLLAELAKEFPTVFESDADRKEIYECVCKMVLATALVVDANVCKAYENVVESNFTKFPLTDDIILGKELEWFEKESKYDDVCVEESEGFYIFRCNGGEGKIVKPSVFVEPKLEKFIDE